MELRSVRPHRGQGQPALPRRDDVRRVGQHGPRRLRSGSSTRARRRHQLHRHRRRLLGAASPRRSSPRRCGAGATHVVLATKVHGTMGDDPNQYGNSRRWIIREVEDRLRRLGTDYIDLYQIHRPEPRHRHRGDARRADRPRARRARSATSARSTYPASRDRRGAVGGARPRPRALRLRAAAVLDARPRHRGRRAADRAPLRHGGDPVEPAGRRLAVGPLAQGRRHRRSSPRAERCRGATTCRCRRTSASSTRPTRWPARRRGGALAHPPGARLRDQPPGGDRGRSSAAHDGAPRVASSAPPTWSSTTTLLDRIDELVPPGTNLNPADAGWTNPDLEPTARRR